MSSNLSRAQTALALRAFTEIPPDLVEALWAAWREDPPKAHLLNSFRNEPGAGANLWLTRGSVPRHVDDVADGAPEEPWVTLGLVLVNEAGVMLQTDDCEALLPLDPGTVYRLDPLLPHGTVAPDGGPVPDGAFIFIAYDMPAAVEDTPEDFVDYALEGVRDRISDLLASLSSPRP